MCMLCFTYKFMWCHKSHNNTTDCITKFIVVLYLVYISTKLIWCVEKKTFDFIKIWTSIFSVPTFLELFLRNFQMLLQQQLLRRSFNIITPFPSLWPLETSDLWCFKWLDKENMGLAWVKRLHSQSGWDFYEPFKTIFSLI